MKWRPQTYHVGNASPLSRFSAFDISTWSAAVAVIILWLCALPCYATSGTITEWKLFTTSSGGVASQAYILPPDGPAFTKFVVDLSALQVLPKPNLTAGTGIVVQTGAQTYTARSIANGTGISVSNGSGVSGNPTISLSNQLTAGTCTSCNLTYNAQGQITVAANGGGGTPDLTGSTGLVAQTGASAYSARTITPADSSITVSNGSGVAGNPTISVATAGIGNTQLDPSVIQHATITLNPTQVKALGTATTFVAAPGANKVIVPLAWASNLTFNSVAYATHTSVSIYYHTGGAALAGSIAINNGSSTTNVALATTAQYSYASSSNLGIDLQTGDAGNPTAGDSNIRFDLWYTVVAQP